MVGVIILTLGLPSIFASIEHGGHIDNRIMVAGYVVMRIAMMWQWLRVARESPTFRSAGPMYAAVIGVAQIGWTAVAILDLEMRPWLGVAAILFVVEMAGPYLAEQRCPTPWHAHHIAERYGLIVIITLGEIILGTVSSVAAVVGHENWTWEAVIIAFAGVGIAFGFWWLYFTIPSAEVIHANRQLSFGFGYIHIILLGAIAAVGAGLHVMELTLEHEATVHMFGAMLSVSIPGIVFVLTLGLIYRILMGRNSANLATIGAAVGVFALAAALAWFGVPPVWYLVVAVLAPVPAIIAEERDVDRHRRQRLESIG